MKRNIEKYLELENGKDKAIEDYVRSHSEVFWNKDHWTSDMWKNFVDWLFTKRRHRWLVTFKTYGSRYEQTFRVDAFSEKDAVEQVKSMVSTVNAVFDVLDLGITTDESTDESTSRFMNRLMNDLGR